MNNANPKPVRKENTLPNRRDCSGYTWGMRIFWISFAVLLITIFVQSYILVKFPRYNYGENLWLWKRVILISNSGILFGLFLLLLTFLRRFVLFHQGYRIEKEDRPEGRKRRYSIIRIFVCLQAFLILLPFYIVKKAPELGFVYLAFVSVLFLYWFLNSLRVRCLDNKFLTNTLTPVILILQGLPLFVFVLLRMEWIWIGILLTAGGVGWMIGIGEYWMWKD